MRNTGLDEAQAEVKIAKGNVNNLRYTDDTTLTAESEGELKSFLMKMKEESEKSGSKLNIKKSKIMASCPIISWQIEKEKVETITYLFSLAPKSLQMVTAATKLKSLASLKKSYEKPRQYMKKQRHYLANKGPSGQSYGLSSSHVRM